MSRYFIFLFLLLMGCQQQYSQSFLLSHPPVLHKEVGYCENTNSDYCNQVRNTLALFIELANARNEDPEKFGETILLEQAKLVTLRQALSDAQSTDKNQSQKLQNDYQVQQKKVNDLLAIVAAMSSPNL